MHRLVAVLLALFIAGPAAAEVFDTARRQRIDMAAFFDRLAAADVVFLGEQHDDKASHRIELEVLQALAQRKRPVSLALEMFERHQQADLAAYTADRITEPEFLTKVAPWSNYKADYRPLVEFAKAQGWPVTGTNAPRTLAASVAKQGLSALGAADPALVARDIQCPDDAYRAKFVEAMGGHGDGRLELVYQAQCIKDETMAESLAALAKPGVTVVHVNGSFHSDGRMGTVSRLLRRRPDLNVVVVSMAPRASLEHGATLETSGMEADLLVLSE